MNDTPLHEHPAVLHLMGTEHWPTNDSGSKLVCVDRSAMLVWSATDENGDPIPDPLRVGPNWLWVSVRDGLRYEGNEVRYAMRFGFCNRCDTTTAHSLITLAAVRGMWAAGYMPRQWEYPGGINTKACAVYNYEKGGFFGPYGAIWLQPTEPLAILAAYQATVMGGGE